MSDRAAQMRATVATASSWLFVPGDRQDRFAKALSAGAGVVVCDLEDSVQPQNKESARRHVAAHLSYGAEVAVRVNASGSPWHDADIEAIVGSPALVAVMVPKAEDADLLRHLSQRLGHKVPLIPLIESAAGIANAAAIASAPGVSRVAFGSIDYALDIGAAETDSALLHARSVLVLASRLAGIGAPIDGVTTQLEESERTTYAAMRAKELGFGAKLCIHPSQVEPVNSSFGTRAHEVAWALRIVGQDTSSGATVVDGAMVDEPVRERARRILRAAESANLPSNTIDPHQSGSPNRLRGPS